MTIGQVLSTPNERAMIRERDDAYGELARGGRPGVSVCIPCFNQTDYLVTSLNSVFCQTVRPFEVIIVDDGSTDGDVEATVAQLQVPDETTVSVVRVTNRGLPGARNAGLMLARGEAFLPLDADDWLDPRYIELTLPKLQEGADVVLTGIQEHGERTGRYEPGFDRPHWEVDLDVMWQYNRFFYCSLFRTRTLREVGGYNGRMTIGYEDWDLWIDLMNRGVRFDSVPDPIFNYRTKAESMWHEAERRRGEIVAEMRRHHGR